MPWRADDTGPLRDPGRDPGCEQVRDWIDPYLDALEEPAGPAERDPDAGLEPARREALEAHAADCPDCRSELALARRLRRELRPGLPLLSCPPEVSDAVLRIAAAEASAAEAHGQWTRRTRRTRWTERLAGWLGGGVLRPALAAAALVLLALAGPLLYRAVIEPGPSAPGAVADGTGSPDGALDPDAEPSAEYSAEFSAAEIAEAEEQARMILAYVASVGRDAGRAVQEDVFDPGIVRPTRQVVTGIGGGTDDAARRNRP
jgi:hypothetical protein